MTQQLYNPQLIEWLASDFPRRKESSYAWGNALNGLMLTPRLRAQYGVSTDENWNLYDHSGQGRMLTANSAGATRPMPQLSGITPWVDFILANQEYYYRADEPGLDLATAGSLWGWVRFDAPMTGVGDYFFGKWNAVGNQRSYLLRKEVDNSLRFYISGNGVLEAFATDAIANYTAGIWIFLAGSFTGGASIDLFVGIASTGAFNQYTTVTAVASLFNGTAQLQAGGNTYSVLYHDGGMSLFGMAEIALPRVAAFNMFHQTRPLFTG